MQTLCQWEVQRDESHEALLKFVQRDAAAVDAVGYATELVLGFWEQREDVDIAVRHGDGRAPGLPRDPLIH